MPFTIDQGIDAGPDQTEMGPPPPYVPPVVGIYAVDLVGMVRDLIQHPSPNVFRDGFADDADTDGTPILRWLNQAMTELLPTGFCKSLFKFTTVAGQSEYPIAADASEMQHVLINSLPLCATTFLGMDRRFPGWQSGAVLRGLPTRYYTYSDQIGLDPCPDRAYDVFYMADAVPAPLAARADIPQRLPLRFHSTLAFRAAWHLSNMDIENEVAAKRMPALEARWNKDYADLQALTNHRLSDLDEQVLAGDYRRDFFWGGRY